VWYQYLAKNQLRLDRVQNRFLAYVAFLLKIPHPQHDYTSISSTLNVPSLVSRLSDLLSTISFVSLFIQPAHTPYSLYQHTSQITIIITLFIEFYASSTPLNSTSVLTTNINKSPVQTFNNYLNSLRFFPNYHH
jgi:hypothetical protein